MLFVIHTRACIYIYTHREIYTFQRQVLLGLVTVLFCLGILFGFFFLKDDKSDGERKENKQKKLLFITALKIQVHHHGEISLIKVKSLLLFL